MSPCAPTLDVAFALKPDSFAITALISAGSTCHVAAFCSTSASICAGGTGAATVAGIPLPGASAPPACGPRAGLPGRNAAASAVAKRGEPLAGSSGALPGGGAPVISAIRFWTAAISAKTSIK